MDLTSAAWRTSSYSGGNGGQCVEVAVIVDTTDSGGGLCAIRDSRNRQGAVLAFSPGQWSVLTGKVKAGQLGLVCRAGNSC